MKDGSGLSNQKSSTPVTHLQRSSTQPDNNSPRLSQQPSTELKPPVEPSQNSPQSLAEQLLQHASDADHNHQTSPPPPIPSPKPSKQPSVDQLPVQDIALDADVEEDEEGDYATPSSTDDGVYCICRGPDDHTWMISCNACDEWFHGRCVNMSQELDDIIERYICPTCTSASLGHTTYRALCSRAPCLRAAKMPSKYCSEACKIQNVTDLLAHAKPVQTPPNSTGKAKTGGGGGDVPLPTRGGTLTLNDLKAAVLWSGGDVDKFTALGNNSDKSKSIVANAALPKNNEEGGPGAEAVFDARLSLIELSRQRALASGTCGYDVRLSWSNEEFGRALGEGMRVEEPWRGGSGGDNGGGGGGGDDGGVCRGKRKCNKHVDWVKMGVKEVQFEREMGRRGLGAY
ncbi:MAG: hypothetical protein Q9227_003773 [Pyrenula ochraceoflavens]